MDKRVAVVIIHGIGSQRSDFAEGMIRELTRRIGEAGGDADAIAWRSIYWADVLEGRQLKYLRDAERKGDLDFLRLRKFVLTALGDASAYQRVDSANSTYQEIHRRIGETIAALYRSELDSQPVPLIVLAHSLGGHIISNYIWDMQRSVESGLSPFERMEYLSGIVTFGCNIPLFTFAHEKVVPIEFPPPTLAADLKRKAKWFNYYDPDDILGYPLKPINSDYSKVVSRDIAVNVGGVLSSWNPASHNGYWEDNDITRPVAKYIREFLK